MSSVGNRLRSARERQNLKQIQVMEKTGINNKTLSGYENGVSEPDIDSLKLLAELYEVSVDWLAGGSGPHDMAKEAVLDEFVEEYKKLSEGDQEYILGLLKRMPKK